MLALVGRGLRCREIAMMLGIAPFTVRKHRCNILGKLGLHSTAQLVACAVRMSSLPDDALDRTALAALSKRERQVVELVCDGLTSKEIARCLGISPGTVRKHRENASARLRVRGMAQMIRCMDLACDSASRIGADYGMGVISPDESDDQHQWRRNQRLATET